MIELVTLAEERLAKAQIRFPAAPLPAQLASLADIAPILRGARRD